MKRLQRYRHTLNERTTVCGAVKSDFNHRLIYQRTDAVGCEVTMSGASLWRISSVEDLESSKDAL